MVLALWLTAISYTLAFKIDNLNFAGADADLGFDVVAESRLQIPSEIDNLGTLDASNEGNGHQGRTVQSGNTNSDAPEPYTQPEDSSDLIGNTQFSDASQSLPISLQAGLKNLLTENTMDSRIQVISGFKMLCLLWL